MAIEGDEYRIESYDSFTIAGVAERGTDIDARALWADLDEFDEDLHDAAVSGDRYGVFFEFDEGGEEVTYLVGHEVESSGDLSPKLTAVDIPEGRYAVFSRDSVDFDNIRSTINEELLFETDHEMQHEVVFHRYTSTGKQFDFNGTSEWFVPVEDE